MNPGRLLAAGLEVHMCTQGRRADVENAFRRGALTVTPLVRAREILGDLIPGEKVNLEGDIVGKYIAKNAAKTGGLTEEALREAGFLG